MSSTFSERVGHGVISLYMGSDILGDPMNPNQGRHVCTKNLLKVLCLTIKATKTRGLVLKSSMAQGKNQLSLSF